MKSQDKVDLAKFGKSNYLTAPKSGVGVQ